MHGKGGMVVGIVATIAAVLFLAQCGKDLEAPNRTNPLDPETGNDPFNVCADFVDGAVVVRWNQVRGIEVDGYRVYRSMDSLQGYSKISVDISETTYVDTTIIFDIGYYYKVSAYHWSYESSLHLCPPVGPVGLLDWIVVTSPQAEACWYDGSVECIRWSSKGTSGEVKLEVSYNGGGVWTTIATSVVDDGDTVWAVEGEASTNCLIRITDVDGNPTGASATFEVAEPFISVTSPSVGARWHLGATKHIQWNSGGTSGAVKLEVSCNGGGVWTTIATSVVDDGDTVWAVEGEASTNCLIRITDVDGSPASTSAAFEIGGMLEIVPLIGGTFQMGSNNGGSDETPVHTVTVSSFHISKYEVTQAQYAEYDLSHTSHFSGDNLPVETVSWYDAACFCNWLSEREGFSKFYNEPDWSMNWGADGYRLPTEAEWEYACRAGTTTEYYWGDSMDGDYCWYNGNSSSRTHDVGTKLPNSFGLYDMSGNIWEWCNDWYGAYESGAQTDPHGPGNGSDRTFRGGGWNYDASRSRSARRGLNSSDFAGLGLGFRPVRKE